MSKGPGRWQRILLDALGEHDFVGVGATVWGHLGRPATRSEEVAARRAAKSLVEAGRARAIYRRVLTVDEKRKTHQLVLTRLDSTMKTNLIPLNASAWVDTTTADRQPLPLALSEWPRRRWLLRWPTDSTEHLP